MSAPLSDWLDSLKAGDEVFVRSNWRQRIDKVSRLTATQVVVGNQKFRKDTAREVGGGSNWDRAYIRAVEQADRDRIELSALRSQAEAWAKTCDLATLRAVAKLIGDRT